MVMKCEVFVRGGEGVGMVLSGGWVRCDGFGLLSFRLPFAHMLAVPFLASPAFWKVNEACLLSDPSRDGRSFCPAFQRLSFGRFFGNRQSRPFRADAQ